MAAGTPGPLVSVIIPAHDEAHIIGDCVGAALASDFASFEVLVVDDCSSDGTAQIAASFPCRVIEAREHLGVSRARNLGAQEARGQALFFTDADCLLEPDALALAWESLRAHPRTAVGGSYTPEPADPGFYNRFQAVLVNLTETRASQPDYIAAHALLIWRRDFLESGGFAVGQLFGVAAVVEDVEFSHRLRRGGYNLLMNPQVLARHHFGFNLARSLKNAWKKSRVWTSYSLANRDLLSDSGFASRGFKLNVAACGASLALLAGLALGGPAWLGALALALQLVNLAVNREVAQALWRAGPPGFALKALLYYLLIYPLPVGLAGAWALARHLLFRPNGARG